MARSGSFTTGSSYNRSARFEWWVNSQSIEGNYTDIGWQIVGDGSASGYVKSGPFNLWIAGTQFYKSDRIEFYKNTVANSGTHRLYHDNYGNCHFEAYLSCAIWSFSENVSGSGAWDLPTIPRKANVTSATDFNDEGNPTITYNNPGGFRINARLEFGGTYINRPNISNTGSYTFDLTNEERTLLRQKCTGNSITVREVIATCIVGTTENYWSWQDKTMTLANANPIFNNFTYEDTNSTTLALTGNNQNIIKGYSNIQVTISTNDRATAIKEATMSRYRFSCGDSSTDISYSSNEDVSGTINKVPNGTFNVYATDNRNNSTLVTKLANKVIDYIPLSKNEISVVRQNGVSEFVTLNISGNIDLINFGDVINSIKEAKYRYKTGQNDWSQYNDITLTINDNNFSYNGLISGDTQNLGFNIENTYQIEVFISDELSSVTFTDTLGAGIPNLAFAKQGISIMGKYDNTIGGMLQVNGKRIDNVYSTDEIPIGTWKNGKTIYMKVINVGSLPNNSVKLFDHNISVETPILCTGIVYRETPEHASFTLPMNNIDIHMDLTKICIYTTTDRTNCTADAICCYTKTID